MRAGYSVFLAARLDLRATDGRQRLTSAEDWSHYVRLLSVKDPHAREFYETEALRGGWSIRQSKPSGSVTFLAGLDIAAVVFNVPSTGRF